MFRVDLEQAFQPLCPVYNANDLHVSILDAIKHQIVVHDQHARIRRNLRAGRSKPRMRG